MEGRHSRVHNIRKRAPNASTGYLSLEMRMEHLHKVSSTRPALVRGVMKSIHGIETNDGMISATMSAS